MLILGIMLLMGLLASIWGFMMCFLPARWERLTEAGADRWTVPRPKRLHPIIRLGNRAAGIVICAVGCWFVYVAASKIYAVLTGRAVIHTTTQSTGSLPNSPTTGGNAFALLMIVIGVAMALAPAQTVKAFESVWPAGRSVKLPAPKAMVLVRVLGAMFALLAFMFLIR